MENKVISIEYVIKNFIDRMIIEDEIKYHEDRILEIENITLFRKQTAKEEQELRTENYVVFVLRKILKEGTDDGNK